MHVFQTIGVPPSAGSIVLATIGSSAKSRNALVNNATAKSAVAASVPPPDADERPLETCMGRPSYRPDSGTA